MDILHDSIKCFTSLLSPSGSRARLLVLIYHRVLQEPDPMSPGEVTVSQFKWQMNLMANNYNVLPLLDACRLLRAGKLPARAACITFDDGYADNIEVAVPVLNEVGIPATFFIATGFLNGGRMWNDTIIEAIRNCVSPELDYTAIGLGRWKIDTIEDRRRAKASLIDAVKHIDFDVRHEKVDMLATMAGARLPDNLMMTDSQVRALVDAGMEVGAHTVNHPILSSLDNTRARKEIEEGRAMLQELVDRPVTLFAFPNGRPGRDYYQTHVEMVKNAGFEAAFSTRWGVADRRSNLYEMPRFTPWHRSPNKFHLALARSYYW